MTDDIHESKTWPYGCLKMPLGLRNPFFENGILHATIFISLYFSHKSRTTLMEGFTTNIKCLHCPICSTHLVTWFLAIGKHWTLNMFLNSLFVKNSIIFLILLLFIHFTKTKTGSKNQNCRIIYLTR